MRIWKTGGSNSYVEEEEWQWSEAEAGVRAGRLRRRLYSQVTVEGEDSKLVTAHQSGGHADTLCKEWEVPGSKFFIFPESSALSPQHQASAAQEGRAYKTRVMSPGYQLMGFSDGQGILHWCCRHFWLLILESRWSHERSMGWGHWRNGRRGKRRCAVSGSHLHLGYSGPISLSVLDSFWQHSFIQETFTEHLYYARFRARCQGHGDQDRHDLCPHQVCH